MTSVRVGNNGIVKRGIENPYVTRVISTTSTAILTPNSDNYDEFILTAQAEALTIANPTGTPTQGRSFVIRIKDNGTARSITFGSQYRAIGITLPTTTILSKVMYLSMAWNADESKWDVLGLAQQA